MQHAHWDAEVKVRVGDFGGQVPRVAGYDACNDKPCSNCILIHCFVTLKNNNNKKQVQMIVITVYFSVTASISHSWIFTIPDRFQSQTVLSTLLSKIA